MPTLAQLREYVIDTVNEPSVDEDAVDLLLSEAMAVVAGEILLPELDTSGTVLTGLGTEVALPLTYERGLYKCLVAGQGKAPTVLTSMEQMLERYPEYSYDPLYGEVESVCIHAGKLIYYPIPEYAVSVTLFYYRAPTPLVSENQVPDCIPTEYHRKLLANYAIKELWDPIEDGMEGAKVNTARYEQKFFDALAEFDASITQGRSRPAPPRDRKRFL